MKQLFSMLGVALLMASCTEDYKDWVNPQTNAPEDSKTVNVTVGSVAETINLATAGDTVQVFIPSVQVADEAVTTYEVVATNNDSSAECSLEVDAQGKTLASELQNAVVTLYNANPNVERVIKLAIVSYTVVNGQSIKSNNTADVKVKPVGPVIESAYYLTGSINGWDNNNQDYKLTNDGSNPYDNPIFTVRVAAPVDGADVEFKFTPESGLGGDWSGCLAASETEGKFNYNNVGGNFIITGVAGAKFYDITLDMLNQTWSYSVLSFDPFVFFIGATDGWASPDQKLASQGEGVYTGYVYVADPNGWGLEFKFQKRAGDWADDSQLNSNNLTAITGDFEKGSDNIKASAGEGVYYVTLDLSANTLNAIKVTKMGIIGDFNGWGGDVEMTWNATDYCFEATGAGVTANGWKFRVNADWAINLGSNDSAEPSAKINDLVANGKNIGVAGSTIKLYPTRKTSETIYCTVE
jgi:hypothetical protein